MPESTVETPEQIEAISPRRVPSAAALPLADIAGRALTDVGEKQAALVERLKGKAAAVAPAAAEVRTAGEAVTRVAGDRPTAPITPAPPSRGLHDFLAPIEGESPMASISKLISALGIFATGIAGSVKGDARAGLAALSGAMQGWQEGDKERADRAFADWEASSKTMADNWQKKRQAWQDIMESANLSLDEKTNTLKLKMLEEDMAIDPLKVEAEGARYLLGEIDKQQQHLETVLHHRATLGMQKQAADSLQAWREQQTEHWKSEAARHAREAKERETERKTAREEQQLERRTTREEQLLPAQGIWYDKKTKKQLPTITKGEFRAEPERWTHVPLAEAQLLPFIAHGLNQAERAAVLMPRLLAKYSGENIAKAMELRAKGVLAAEPDLREFVNHVEELNVEMTRALGGGGQLRITLLNILRGQVGPRLEDTIATGLRTLNASRRSLENRRDFILDPTVRHPAHPFPIEPGRYRAYDTKTGKMATITLDKGDTWPEHFERVTRIPDED